MNTQHLTNALAKAQRLMLDENFNRQVETAAAFQRGNNGRGGANLSSAQIALMEEQAFGRKSGGRARGAAPVQMIQEVAEPQQPIDYSSSKMPKAILESFKRQPAMSGEQEDTSALAQATSGLIQRRQQMQEQYMPQQSAYQGQGGIDYSIIKALIDESIRTNLQELKQNMLNESAGASLKGVKLVDGNKIQLLDTQGNLYEGILQFKKKVVKG